MSNSAFIKSSIAKKYWMAFTGLFLCLFLVGHLIGNLQLIIKTGEEGRRAFNEYAYFMTHNPAVMVLSYLTYFSILFHAIDGIALFIQNKKARPVSYAYNKPSANSSLPSRYMALLGTIVLVFIATHMSNFWWKMKVSDEVPMHTYYSPSSQDTMYLTQKGEQISTKQIRELGEIEGTQLILKADKFSTSIDEQYSAYLASNPGLSEDQLAEIDEQKKKLKPKKDEILAEGYKDLHTVVMKFFSKKNESDSGLPLGLLGMLLYVVSMAVLGFHLWHGFASAFQSMGMNHPKYTPLIKLFGRGYAVVVPALFAIIPILIYLNS
jgi:succinate dehydrogenase / fumarate reductase cytochrome b subunit